MKTGIHSHLWYWLGGKGEARHFLWPAGARDGRRHTHKSTLRHMAGVKEDWTFRCGLPLKCHCLEEAFGENAAERTGCGGCRREKWKGVQQIPPPTPHAFTFCRAINHGGITSSPPTYTLHICITAKRRCEVRFVISPSLKLHNATVWGVFTPAAACHWHFPAFWNDRWIVIAYATGNMENKKMEGKKK